MHSHDEDPAELQKAIAKKYEHRDLSTSAIGRSVLILFVFFFFSIGITIVVWNLLDMWNHGMKTTSRQEVEKRVQLPPGPLLQSNVTAKQDIKDLRELEQGKLEGYGWSDEKAGIAHIPVDEAMKKMAEAVGQ